jgi:4-amino-4-deoxy-L-arabinose transferase
LWSGFLILFSSFLFSKNEIYVNSTKPIADWIIKNDLKNHGVIVYNQLLPSLAFELNKDIISVSNGDRRLNREIQFEKNDQWKKTLYNLTDTLDMERLETELQTPHLLVSRGELADDVAWLKNGLTKKMKFGNWILFYN